MVSSPAMGSADTPGKEGEPSLAGNLVDSVDAAARMLDQELTDLERARVRLIRLSGIMSAVRTLLPVTEGQNLVVTRLSEEDAVNAVARLLMTDGEIRSITTTLDVGPATDETVIRRGQERLRDGSVSLRQIYAAHLFEEPATRRWIDSWASAGEIQRVHPDPPSEFVVFGTHTAIVAAQWRRPAEGYVLIQDPQLVSTYIALFDATFQLALPVPDVSTETGDIDQRILELMGVGLKDESIARHLNIGLRTVRRRVGRIMDARGLQTRYQLGVAVAEEGLVGPAWTPAWTPAPRAGEGG
ncbi:MAG: hypothetical protein ACK5MP_12330 [Nostocoides sp.]